MPSVATITHKPRSTPPRIYLREWRKTRGLTQEKLGELVGSSKGVVSRHEQQKRGLADHKIAAYAEALELDFEQLFRDPAAPSVDQLMRGATPELKRQIFNVVAAMLKNGADG